MKKIITLILVSILIASNTYTQTYPNNEDGDYEDMLTPEYYLTGNNEPFRNEINTFVHFARLDSFQHPFEDSAGQRPIYSMHRGFGDGIGLNGTSQHHPAIDLHIENGATNVFMYAAYDGIINTYRDAPKYRDYLSLTKNIEDSVGNIIGKMVTIYAHIDLNLDSLDNLLLNGQTINKGDIVSKHLYSGTLGGPHIHFEIRYYRINDIGDEEFYGFVGPDGSTTHTEPSFGSWSYGYWNPNIGYGFGNPENHFSNSPNSIETTSFKHRLSVFPNPTRNIATIDLKKIYSKVNISVYSLVGRIIYQDKQLSTSHINVDLSNFKSGIYLAKVTDLTTNESTVVKIIKE